MKRYKPIFVFLCIAFISIVLTHECCCQEEAEKKETQTIVYLGNQDIVKGEGLVLNEGTISIKLPYADNFQISTQHIMGIAFETGRRSDIFDKPVERDTVYTTKGETLTGTIEAISDEGFRFLTEFAPENVLVIPRDRVLYCIFKHTTPSDVITTENPETDHNISRVLFVNDDLLTGRIMSFTDGKFVFQPLNATAIAFEPDKYKSIHNPATSEDILQGGLAAAMMQRLMKAQNLGSSYVSQMIITLIRAFISSGDKDGAIYIFKNMDGMKIQPYMYRQLADEFYKNKMYKEAIKAYNILLESKQNYYWSWDNLLKAYEKTGQKLEAAKTCERLLKNKDIIARSNKDPMDLKLQAASLYIELKHYAKATAHLQDIIIDPDTKEHRRKEAKEKLIAIYKDRGRLDELVAQHLKQLEEHDRLIGEGSVLLITRYMQSGKLTKAGVELDRLRQYNMPEYTKQAEKVIAENK